MRKLMAAIAIVLVAGLPARSWALLGFDGVTYDGSLEVSATRAANESDQSDGLSPDDRHSDVDTRTRLGINLDVTEGVDGRIEFVRNGTRYGTGATNISGEESLIDLQNLFINLMLWNWNWRIGRQYVGDEGDLVWNIGPRSDDILRVDAIDGVDIRRQWDKFSLDAFAGKATENNPQGGTSEIGERSLKNLMLGFMGVPNNKIWVGGTWGYNSNGANTSDSTKLKIYRAGIRGGVNENFITYRGEVLMNDGEDLSATASGGSKVNYNGRALDLGVGLNLEETGAGQFSFGADFTSASGDDDGDDNDDDSFHDLLEVGVLSTDRYYGEIFGRSNGLSFPVPFGMGLDSGNFAAVGNQGPGFTILHANALYKPSWAPKSWWRLDWYDISATEDSQKVGGVDVERGDFGSEIDLTAGYRHSDTVGFEGGYAMLMPDDGLTGGAGAPDDTITKLFARMKVGFGGGMQQIDPARR
jgi:hypothetical protein